LLHDLLEIVESTDLDIRNVSCAPFSSTRYRGRVFVINSTSGPDEMDALTEIIATRFASELERFALMQQIAESARSEERMQLSRDLHDSVLQNLTATRIKLKLLTETTGGGFKIQLGEIGSLILEQQRRIRQFVEDNRKDPKLDDVKLGQTLSDFLRPLSEQWNCQIDVSLAPPGLQVPKWMVHEIKQLVSEAAANAVCHGRADQLCVSIAEASNGLRLEMVDNGSGVQGNMNPQQPSSLSARVAKLGGDLAVCRTAPGFGIHIKLPACLDAR
jgi:signal transduction histidine kinase